MAKYEIRGMDYLNDRESLLAYGEKFWEQTRYTQVDKRPYSADTVDQLLQLYADQRFEIKDQVPGFVLVVCDREDTSRVVGFGIVAMYPLAWDWSVKCAGELAFYLDEEARGSGVAKRLLQSMENVAKHRGCEYMAMISMEHSMDVGPMYERMDYIKTETTYTKEL